jgi:hypothetical protein
LLRCRRRRRRRREEEEEEEEERRRRRSYSKQAMNEGKEGMGRKRRRKRWK